MKHNVEKSIVMT